MKSRERDRLPRLEPPERDRACESERYGRRNTGATSRPREHQAPGGEEAEDCARSGRDVPVPRPARAGFHRDEQRERRGEREESRGSEREGWIALARRAPAQS